jgi:hypothetical protein
MASRDELLTALIVAAYDALGIAARAQEAAVARSASYEASPKDSAKTGPPSPPGSPSLQFRRRRRPRQRHQDDQKTNVRPGEPDLLRKRVLLAE